MLFRRGDWVWFTWKYGPLFLPVGVGNPCLFETKLWTTGPGFQITKERGFVHSGGPSMYSTLALATGDNHICVDYKGSEMVYLTSFNSEEAKRVFHLIKDAEIYQMNPKYETWGFETKRRLDAHTIQFIKQRLEEKPMKVKKFLIEVHEYNREKKQITDKRNAIVVTFNESHPINPANVSKLIDSVFINMEDDWDYTQQILTIEGGSYKVTSGHMDFSEERLNLLTNKQKPLLEVNMINKADLELFYKEKDNKGKTKTGREYFYIPLKADVQNVLKFYQKKFPQKNYSLSSKTIKKDPSEKSQKLAELPTKGETPGRELRKVCYRPKGGTKVFRDRLDKVKPLVDSGNYVYASKHEWKSQRLDKKGKVVTEGTTHKSNIVQSPTGRKIGERKELREKKDWEKRVETLKKHEERRRRQNKPKVSEEERASQSAKDKEKVAEKRKSSKKEYTPQRVYRAFEAVILGDKAEVLETLFIKARSNGHAEKILKTIVKNKGNMQYIRKSPNGEERTFTVVDARLTGTIKQWKKQSGANRPKKTIT